MAKKTHDAVYVERYNDRDGNEKKRYQNIGSAFTRDDGSMSIKLDSVPVGFTGWISLYVPKDRQESARPAPSRPSAPPSDGFDESSEIPF
jgi:hypothetical protein